MRSRTERTRGRSVRFGTVLAFVIGVAMVGPIAPPAHQDQIVSRDVVVEAGRVGAGYGKILPTEIGAEMVGFTWDGSSVAALEVRALVGAGWWTDPVTLDGSPLESPDETAGEYTPQTAAGPAWVGREISNIEVRVVEGEATNLKMHVIDVKQPEPSGGLALGFGVQTAEAAAPAPMVIPRAAWGADESWRTANCDGRPRYANEVKFAVVHHTVNSNSYAPTDSAALLRGIYHFHVFTNGWCDIAYNFLIDRYGQVFEGRFGGPNKPLIGGHTGGFNTSSTGVAVIGDFTSSPVPFATYSALRALLSWKLSYHGLDAMGRTVAITADHPSARWPVGTPVAVNVITGHRDLNLTDCPGDRLWALLGQLRIDVATDISHAPSPDVLMCDWDGDGSSTPSLFHDGQWAIRQWNSEGAPDLSFAYGAPGYEPVCGDWNGDGRDTIGVFTMGRWLLRNTNGPGYPDVVLDYGAAGYQPVVGDWNGDGRDSIGVFVAGWWLLRNSVTPGYPEIHFAYGAAGYHPVVGDWNRDGRDGVGIFVNGVWRLRNSTTPGPADAAFEGYGLATDTPFVGDWNKDRFDTIGVKRGSWFFLRDILTYGYANQVFNYPSQ